MKPRQRVDHVREAPAITIRQPWAQAVALGLKRFETRGWWTGHRGLILIHAAKRWSKNEIGFHATAVHHLRIGFGVDDLRVLAFEENPPLGCIVAVADLVEVHEAGKIRLKLDLDPFADGYEVKNAIERLFGDFTQGRFAWQIENVVRLVEPVACEGKQGLWYPPASVMDQVAGQIGGAT